MTVSEDFIPVEDGQFEATPTYPTVFGVTFTPVVSGAIIGALGLAGALYMLLNLVMPAWDKYKDLQSTRDQKQAQIEQKKANIARINKVRADLAQAKKQQEDVLALFANDRTLDTLLLDVNRVIEADNSKLKQDELQEFSLLAQNSNSSLKGKDLRARLKKYEPVAATSTGDIVTDSSLGQAVNGKLKRKEVNVEFEGTFAQTQSILRNIERLQPLLLVKDYQSKLDLSLFFFNPQGQITRTIPSKIDTSFQLQALVPVSQDEAAKAASTNKLKK